MLREENTRLKRKIEVEKKAKGKDKEIDDIINVGSRTLSRGGTANETEEESEYNPTPKTKGVSNNSLTSRSNF